MKTHLSKVNLVLSAISNLEELVWNKWEGRPQMNHKAEIQG